MPQLLFSKGAIVLSALIIAIVLEQIFPAVLLRAKLQRWIKNFSLASLNFIVGPLIVVPISAFAEGHAAVWRPDFLTGILLDLLVLDLWIYFWHRANHRLPFLWRFHEVHHLDENLDATSALRFHFGEVALSSFVRAGLIFALAIPLRSVVVFETIVTVAAIFHHSNIKLPQRFEVIVSKLVVTPSIHFIHHHALRSDTDSNYATVLSLWDRLFRTCSKTQRSSDLKIGVEGMRDVPIVRLILRPFLKS